MSSRKMRENQLPTEKKRYPRAGVPGRQLCCRCRVVATHNTPITYVFLAGLFSCRGITIAHRR